MNIKKSIRKIILESRLLFEVFVFISGKKLNRKIIDRKIAGLNKKNNKEIKHIDKLIVSLTTYGERVKDVHYTLYSILDQSILPEKIVLWVSYNDYEQNREYLTELLDIFGTHYLEIKQTKDIRSYTKLVPALESFSDYFILTADDDIYYKKNWLKKIWNEHEKYPEYVMCHFAHRIVLENGRLLPYKQWKKTIKDTRAGYKIFGCGCGGVVYHKKYLYNDITNESLFLELSPNADDIWFYFMVVLNNTKYKVVKNPCNHLKYTDIYKEYGLNKNKTLKVRNVDQGMNDIQFNAVMQYYNLNINKLYE
ncbi:hypothetical protein FACS189461_0920 [Spirochaetia bacterium]|nr:hypothetical protein FACS189461_0920 [Spirochaetia bacterium]